MKLIKNNPSLDLFSLEDKVKTPFNALIVSPYLEKTATELFNHFIQNVFKFEKNGKKLTTEEAIKMNLFDSKVIVETKLKEKEWLLITQDETYYSRGDGSNGD